MAYCIVCGVGVDVDDALSIVYQGRTYYFDSLECKDRFFLIINSDKEIKNHEELPSEDADSLSFGEFPDPNDLKTHGDIGGWTDKKYI